MDILNEKTLKEQISAGKILPVYLLFGDDGYLINHYENILIDKTCGKNNDFDLLKFEKDIDLQAVFDALNQFPMFGDRKCVVLSDYDFESSSADEFDKLISLLSDSYEFSTLILKLEDVSFDLKHSSRAKKISTAVKEGGGCIFELRHRDISELAKMLVNGAKKRGFTLDIGNAKFMIETCGADINTLVSELDKLCRYADGDTITESDIETVCIKSVDASVYEYVKHIINCNSSLAFSTLDDLIYMRLEPIVIMYTAASAFIDIARVGAANISSKTFEDITADFPYKNKEFLITRAKANLKKLDDKKLTACLNEILNADKLLKSLYGEEKTILEQMTVRLIYIIANGEQLD